MFRYPIPTLTDAEIAADIATLRKIVSTGCINGYPMDGETEDEMRAYLAEYEEEQRNREEAEEQKEAA